ncbi:MAG: hypothetical protein ACOH1Y_16890 [Propionicimonas sp.]
MAETPGTSNRTSGTTFPWVRAGASASLAEFARTGWTEADWDDLYDRDTWTGPNTDLQYCIQEWLRHPPKHFEVPVTPATVRATLARFGTRAPLALNAYAAGASKRFVGALTDLAPQVHNPDGVWWYTTKLGLTEPEAVGWALTGDLLWPVYGVDSLPHSAPFVTRWVDRFGPKAYLWVLAGYDLTEAVALQAAGTVVTEDQLRVMVALNGTVLPDDI